MRASEEVAAGMDSVLRQARVRVPPPSPEGKRRGRGRE